MSQHNREDVETFIRKTMISDGGVDPDADFTQTVVSLGMDSLDWLEVIMMVEDNYDVKIRDEQIDSVNSLPALADFVLRATE